MKKIMILQSALCIFAFCIFAAEENKASGNRLEDLLKQHKQYLQELAKLREKAILEDEELKELHKKILELHAQLAAKLDEKKEIKELNDKIIALEKDIEKEREEEEKKRLLKD